MNHCIKIPSVYLEFDSLFIDAVDESLVMWPERPVEEPCEAGLDCSLLITANHLQA